ncbi:hypothetical protein FBZ89_1341 [Nitrospirillum amazonense]|uniref:Uncharacterized protein n=1 Tax=Nitrospirillum amazonense TaxID=28077 RepID=A0A560EMB2_9PROT|nr:hypothetical protein FBZ89_1341 [Nitrospirillum amazonense]
MATVGAFEAKTRLAALLDKGLLINYRFNLVGVFGEMV